MQNYASVNSFIYFIRGLGTIIGAPVAGTILGSHQRGTSLKLDPVESGLAVIQQRYNDVAVYDTCTHDIFLLVAHTECVSFQVYY